ncbi:MAG: ABC transporter ATP-binding protein [Rhizomicrobium sp.]
MSAAPAIDIRDVSRSFGPHRAVSHLSFSVLPNEIFGLVGPDGAGKTTTMRMLAGVMRPDEGSIIVDGVDVVANPDLAKARFSYMPQRFGLYEDLTVDENIRFYADLFGIPRAVREERSARLLAASDMGRFRDRLAGVLSGGMKQKLGLTCALIHAPKIVLLDEPTTGVDPVSRRDFWRILYDLREGGLTIVISTAYLDEAERCHRLALLYEGELLECDTPAALKRHMPGAILSIASRSARAIRDTVGGCPGVLNTMLVGNSIHVVVDDADRRMPEIEKALAASGLPFDSLTRVEPTIEDLFVTLQNPRKDAAA